MSNKNLDDISASSDAMDAENSGNLKNKSKSRSRSPLGSSSSLDKSHRRRSFGAIPPPVNSNLGSQDLASRVEGMENAFKDLKNVLAKFHQFETNFASTIGKFCISKDELSKAVELQFSKGVTNSVSIKSPTDKTISSSGTAVKTTSSTTAMASTSKDTSLGAINKVQRAVDIPHQASNTASGPMEFQLSEPSNKRKGSRLRKVPIEGCTNRFSLLREDCSDDDGSDEFPALQLNKPFIKKIKKSTASKTNINLNNNLNSSNALNINVESLTNNNINKPPADSNVHVEKKNAKLPPITGYNLNLKELRDELIKAGTTSYHVKRGANANRQLIFAEDRPTYTNILNLLDHANSKYFAFTPKEDRGINLILKNIPQEYNVKDLEKEFVERNLMSGVEKIVPLYNNEKTNFNFFIIKLKQDIQVSKYTNTHYLFNIRVFFEKFNRSDLIQCFRCQRPGHVSSNCKMEPRCVKCGNGHERGKCLLEGVLPKVNLYCVLCKKNGHPANYRGCPTFQKVIEDKIKNKNQKKNNVDFQHANFVRDSASRFVSPNFSFANVAGGGNGVSVNSNAKSSPPSNKMLDLLNNESLYNFGCDYATLNVKFSNYMENLNSAKSPLARSSALLNFILETQYNG